MLYRTHIISDVCYIGHAYQTYFCFIEHTHWIYLYYTRHYIRHIHVISDILMLYRTCLCLSDTHRTYLFCIGPFIFDVFVISDIFMLWLTYFFYRACSCPIGHICVVWDTYYIGHIYVISARLSDVFMLYRAHVLSDVLSGTYIGHTYRTHLCAARALIKFCSKEFN